MRELIKVRYHKNGYFKVIPLVVATQIMCMIVLFLVDFSNVAGFYPFLILLRISVLLFVVYTSVIFFRERHRWLGDKTLMMISPEKLQIHWRGEIYTFDADTKHNFQFIHR